MIELPHALIVAPLGRELDFRLISGEGCIGQYWMDLGITHIQNRLSEASR